MSRAAAHAVWIDVGGTFTDCIAPEAGGGLRVHKLLSSGVYGGRVGPGSSAAAILDPARAADPPGFFAGWRLSLPDLNLSELLQLEIETAPPIPDAMAAPAVSWDIASNHHGELTLATPLPAPPLVGQRYELRCDEDAPLIGARWLLRRGLRDGLADVDMRLGTTRGTNALLERTGAVTALVTTRGFADVLRIASQARPRLFDLHIRKPADLYVAVAEIDERVDARGHVLRVADADQIRAALAPLHARGVQSLAVCLLNSYRNAAHELLIERVARELGFRYVSLSAQLAPLQRIVPRGQTTVVDAYLAPRMDEYVRGLARGLRGGRLRLMSSAGALISSGAFRARDSVLSGPAGGVVAVARVAQAAGIERAIGFDMGGTSTDVCRFDGCFERRHEMEIEDRATGGALRIVAPLLAIETVAAGGGSICAFDGSRLTVGPHSAGADPGPACYGRGGPLCLTDANLLLGRILVERFPFPLDSSAARRRLDEIAARLPGDAGRTRVPEALAEGFVEIANAHMSAAIRKVSVQRGYDPRDHALICFGGAGGQHACAVAAALGIRKIVVHPLASALSALGIGCAPRAAHRARDVGMPLDEHGLARVATLASEMFAGARAQLEREGVAPDRHAAPLLSLDLRYVGQDAALTVARPGDGDWRAAFEQAHRRLYGFAFAGRAVEIRAARAELTESDDARPPPPPPYAHTSARPSGEAGVWLAGERRTVPVFERGPLNPGETLRGPALVVEPTSVLLIEPGWQLCVAADLALVIEQRPQAAQRVVAQDSIAGAPDPVQLELFANAFMSIAEQMGATLQRTSLSTNVKERLDFSCAVCDARGELVAHAPHIPVHLGAMSHAVGCVMQDVAAAGEPMQPGDFFVTNDPYRGGSHLPDVTVVTPVFDPDQSQVVFFVANRAHHAEIGGIVPGSMPASSRTLAEEGVLIRTLRLTTREDAPPRAGRPQIESELRRVLLGGPYPTRAIEQNLADIAAQIAANGLGVRLLEELSARHGTRTVSAYMGYLQDASEAAARDALRTIAAGSAYDPPAPRGASARRLPDGQGPARSRHRCSFADALDDGTPIAVTITIDEDGAIFDFSGSGGVHAGNLNATPAIVASAVLYCLRCLIDRPIPLNAGVLRPVRMIIPPGILNPPRDDDPVRCPAVVGGNVETSQRLVDCIFGALGVVAASQGTMNNFAFGNDHFGYYETIGGGAGAGPSFPGADAVHVHMTNTRLTDPEVLEDRYPVRLRRFAIRRGSGGVGAQRGGDGIVREVEFLAPLDVSLLTQRRTRAPYGLAGGGRGSVGRNSLIRGDGTVQELPWAAQLRVAAGERILIETPGGGAFGRSRA